MVPGVLAVLAVLPPELPPLPLGTAKESREGRFSRALNPFALPRAQTAPINGVGSVWALS